VVQRCALIGDKEANAGYEMKNGWESCGVQKCEREGGIVL